MSIKKFVKKIIASLYMFSFEYFNRYKWLQSTYRKMIFNYDKLKP
jgi:hypothetical protein